MNDREYNTIAIVMHTKVNLELFFLLQRRICLDPTTRRQYSYSQSSVLSDGSKLFFFGYPNRDFIQKE
jgi:hypothetical protein